jgi:MFS family permease
MSASSPESRPSEPLSPEARSVLGIVFLTLFLDLVGFSIVFPLFPAMLTYYLELEGESGILGTMVAVLDRFSAFAGSPNEFGAVVFFGGALGSLYALLQFVFAPIFGTLSDRVGRRPILLVTIAGLAVSYALWIFAGSFALLIAARVLGGIMSSNISTATAVVADVTSVRNRGRGMALIGMAFGLGFIVGPAIGGFSAAIDLTERYPDLAAYGVNPFSVPAIIAFVLSVINLGFVALRFPETLKPEARSERVKRTVNPAALFRAENYPGVTPTNWTNFLFLSAFAGMEFTLTFLAMDRLDYGPRRNGLMFLFVGIVLAAVQGGYVRRRADAIGPRKMAMHGLITTMPGLVCLAFAQSTLLLYVGLFFMAVGSAQVIPCLTSLASAYAPPHEQGRILGVFRSLGALARALGPIAICLIYWRWSATAAYLVGAAFILLPLYVTSRLPEPRAVE